MANMRSKRRERQGSSRQGAGSSIPRSWLIWGGAAVVVAAIVIVFAVPRAGSSRQSAPASSAGSSIGAPDFRLTLYQGADVLGAEQLNFSDTFGRGKPVVLNFFAGLCPPCRAEMPGFQRVYSEFGDKLIFLGLDIGPFIGLGSNQDARNLLQELQITYPAGTTSESSVVAQYQVRGMPTTVFLTAQGEILDIHTGFLDEATLRSKVESLIQASAAS